ncbi:MAG: S9 family peptidase [Flavobacteriales bacterium]|nr:S9 family peptidase [Flavobacteriales bacterium]
MIGAITAASLTSCGDGGGEMKQQASLVPPPVIDMKDFFRNPEKASFQISPDGNYMSYRAPWRNRMNIFVQRMGDSAATQVTHDTIRDIGGYFWKGDRLVYTRDINGDENFIVFSASMDGKDVKALTPEKGVRAGTLDRLHNVPGMEQTILVSMNQRNPEIFDPYSCNIVTGELKSLYDNSKDEYQGWITDHTGVIRFATKTDGTDQVYYYRANPAEPFKEYMRTGYKDSWEPLLFTFDNTDLIVSHNLNGRDKTAVVEWDLAGKKERKLIFENADYDVSNVDYSDKRKVLRMVTWTGWKEERHILDEQTKALYDKLASKFEGYDYWIYGENDEETKFMVWAGSDRQPGKYYFYDATADKLEHVATLRPWINEEHMAEMRPISYQSRDGLTIHGYLTLPKGREAKDLPVIINPHGGPWARDEWGFNSQVQWLANRGYAVLQMNFRGSTGYGREFWTKSFKQWGRTMQDDITDGVEWLKKEGIADSTRIAIYGASYGGYATLAGITFTPELYTCAVDYVGVSNMFTFMNTIPPYWEAWRKQMYEMVGDPKADSVLLRAASPVFFVDQIQCPLFIAQGATDPRVNKAESDQVVEALKARGVEVQYMVKDNEGHGFRNEENRFDFYGAMEKFLDQHIGEGRQATAVKG